MYRVGVADRIRNTLDPCYIALRYNADSVITVITRL